jgi:hypothetical protein
MTSNLIAALQARAMTSAFLTLKAADPKRATEIIKAAKLGGGSISGLSPITSPVRKRARIASIVVDTDNDEAEPPSISDDDDDDPIDLTINMNKENKINTVLY